ncbi:MAG TPA: SDR family oxidoreductase [Verrucomicrobiae bacterium]|nr:SDR family oxidoreductase [Verrucomicrobiae bacterium]
MRVLIIGCGYTGIALGRELAQRDHSVCGVRRSRSSEKELTDNGIQPLFCDATQLADLQTLPRKWDWVVNCIGAERGTSEEYRRTYLESTRNLLSWLEAAPPKRFVYTSSTSVYGQEDGSWVSETDPAEPVSEAGRILIEAEDLLRRAWNARFFPAIVLRLSGIYGPGRGYWLKQYLAGEPFDESSDRFLNMVHLTDVVGAIIATLERGVDGSTVNVSDDEPATQRTVFRWLSETLPQPPQKAGVLTGRRRAATNKRVSNRKLKEELRYPLKYASFREGFSAELRRLGKL